MPPPEHVIASARALCDAPGVTDVLLGRCLRRFTAVRDRALRRTVLRDFLEEVDDASLVAVLFRVDQRVLRGDPECRWLATELALTPSVIRELPYLRVAELYSIAAQAELTGVASRFLGHVAPLDYEGDNPHFERSAGERTAAARGRDRMVLDRLLFDKDARVIAALLDNPRITEVDVVRIAAMHPTQTLILEHIVSHPRWGQRYRIRKTVAFNPCTPVTVARQVLPTLLRQDLRALAGLVPALRADIATLIQRPGPAPDAPGT